MQNTAKELLAQHFEGNIEEFKKSIEEVICHFSSNVTFPESEQEHLEYQRSMNKLWVIKKVIDQADLEKALS